MQLERIALHLRPRSAWEALDLGLAMAAAWRGPALRAWLATYWITGLLLIALLNSHIEIAVLILWWLKPLFDRVLLHVFSRALFGEATSVRTALQALRPLARSPGLLSSLTLRRLSMARSFLLPVWQLEHLHGKVARQRFHLLGARQRSHAAWLTFFCANASTILWFSGLLVVQMLAPVGYTLFDWEQWVSDETSTVTHLISALMYMAAETLIEPYFVAAGFALYLNRRSELEGWDIEVAFRRLATRKAAEAQARPLRAGALLLALGLTTAWMAGTPGDALAEEVDNATEASLATTPTAPTTPTSPAATASASKPQPSRARREIDAVLADPVFGKQVDDTRWQWIEDETPESKTRNPGWMKTLRAFINGLSSVLKALVGVVGVVALALLLWMVWRTRERWQSTAPRAAPPTVLFGLDVRPESLPSDIAAAALAEGDPVRALSLLYRGTLVTLIHRHQAEFRQGDTEADCLQRSQPHLSPEGQTYFAALLDTWRRAAYASQPPGPAALHALCTGWSHHFAATVETRP